MQTGKYHILIVDDNEDRLTMLKLMLEHTGYKISIQGNTANIKSVIISAKPDVIIMDKLLSGSDGCEVCKLLKADSKIKHIPVIMISAHAQASEECIEAGASYFLEKPFEMDELLQTVANATKAVALAGQH